MALFDFSYYARLKITQVIALFFQQHGQVAPEKLIQAHLERKLMPCVNEKAFGRAGRQIH